MPDDNDLEHVDVSILRQIEQTRMCLLAAVGLGCGPELGCEMLRAPTIAPSCKVAKPLSILAVGVARRKMEAGMATQEKTLDDLFLDTLKDIYYAEKQIVKALPRMAKAAQSQELSAAFLQHAEESEGHVARLEQVFQLIGKPARGKTCDAILGILEEGKSIMEDFAGTMAVDAGLVAAAQAVEHYEIARYGTLNAWAQQLGHLEAAKLFEATLNEELATDKKLTKLGEARSNPKAA